MAMVGPLLMPRPETPVFFLDETSGVLFQEHCFQRETR